MKRALDFFNFQNKIQLRRTGIRFPVITMLLTSLLLTSQWGCIPGDSNQGSAPALKGLENVATPKTQPSGVAPIDSIPYNQLINGEKEGLWREYYQNGNLRAEYHYQNGKKNGYGRQYWDGGVLLQEAIYENDLETGLVTWYNEQGQIIGEGEMQLGKREGPWKICDAKKGDYCIKAHYKAGKKDGTWELYHENGALWKSQEWRADKLETETCWDAEGNPIICR